MRGAERPLFSSFQGENLGCFLPLPGEPGPLIRPRGPHLGEETAGRALGKWRKQGSVQPARTGVRSGIRSPYQAGPSAAYIRAEHCRLSHLWPHGPNLQERPFTRTTGASRKGGERMLELAKEFLVILAGVLAGERIGRWIDKRFKK